MWVFLLKVLCLFSTIETDAQQYTKLEVTEDGLPSSVIYKVVQDNNGFIWIATDNGIVRWDGNQMKVFNRSHGLKNPDIWDLYVDDQNRVWYSNKSKYHGYILGDQVYSFPSADSNIFSTSNFHIGDSHFIFSTPEKYYKFDGANWVPVFTCVTVSGGLSFYQFEGKQFHSVGYIYSPEYQVILTDPKGELYTYYLNDSLVKLEVKGNTIGQKKSRYGQISVWQNYIVFLLGKGVLIYNTNTDEYNYVNLSDDVSIQKWQPDVLSKVGDFLSISGLGATVLIDSNFNIHEVYEGLLLDDAYRTQFDDQDGTWHFTPRGLYYQSVLQKNAKDYFLHSNVTQLEIDGDQLIIGINNGLANILDISTEDVHSFGPRISNNDFVSTRKYADYIYIANQHNIYRRPVNSRSNFEVLINTISTIKDFIIKDDTLFISNSGAIAAHPMSSIPRKGFDLAKSRAFLCLIPFQQEIYTGMSQGLFKLEDNELKNAIEPELEVNVICGLEYEDGILTGTKGAGLYYVRDLKASLIPGTETWAINNILMDEKGFVWLSTDRGAVRMQIDQMDVSKSKVLDRFTTDDGLINNYVNDLVVNDSTLWVATGDGLSKINWEKARELSTTRIFLPSTDSIDISSRTYYPVNFSIVDYLRSDNLEKYYRLEDYSDDWIPIENNQIILSNLRPGSHNLDLLVRNAHGKEYKASSSIYVKPHWYESLIFRILFYLLIAVVLVGLVLFISRRNEKVRRQKMDEEKNQINQELSALRSQLNPHFIFNSLNAIQYFINDNNTHASEVFLTKFSTLIRQVFEFSKYGAVKLSDELDMLDNYLKLEKMRFGDKLNYTTHIDEGMDVEETYIPSMLLQPFVENSINHGIFHKASPGNLELSISNIDDDYFYISVVDDGIGINAGKQISDRINIQRSHRSSDVIAKRIELLNKSAEGTIVYTLEELQEDGNVKGTKVGLKIRKQLADTAK